MTFEKKLGHNLMRLTIFEENILQSYRKKLVEM